MEPLEHPYLESSDEVRVVSDAKGRFLGVNAYFSDALGYSRQTICGRYFFEFLYPSDVDISLGALEHIVAGDGLAGFENTYRTRAGHYIRLRWYFDGQDDAGHLLSHAQIVSHAVADPELLAWEPQLFNDHEAGDAGNAIPELPEDCLDILLVEDNPHDRELVERIVANLQPDATVVGLEDQKNVIETLKLRAFRCVVLDYLLPTGTGLGILRLMHSTFGADVAPPVIMLSGLESQLLYDRAQLLGVVDFVPKSALCEERFEEALGRVSHEHKRRQRRIA